MRRIFGNISLVDVGCAAVTAGRVITIISGMPGPHSIAQPSANSSNESFPTFQSDAVMFDVFLPGYSFPLRAMSSDFHVDVSFYLFFIDIFVAIGTSYCLWSLNRLHLNR